MNFHLSIKKLGNLGQIQFISKHKNPFDPQAPDLLEKLAESLLYNLHREHILLKLKINKLLPKILQLEFSELHSPCC